MTSYTINSDTISDNEMRVTVTKRFREDLKSEKEIPCYECK